MWPKKVSHCYKRCYLRRLRAVGVTEAVGEEEDMESGEEAALITIREDEEAPSWADMSRFISSLLRRDTDQEQIVITIKPDWWLSMLLETKHHIQPEIVLVESMLETLWRTDGGRLAEAPLRRCSAMKTSKYHTQHRVSIRDSSPSEFREDQRTGPTHSKRKH